MDSKFVIFTILVIVSVNSVNSFPRDASGVNTQDVLQINDERLEEKQKPVEDNPHVDEEGPLPRGIAPKTVIPCPFDEATEVEVCRDHCLPQGGYKYGLCISYKCFCV